MTLGELIPVGYNKNINDAFDACKAYILKNISQISDIVLMECTQRTQQLVDEYNQGIEALKQQKEDIKNGLPVQCVITSKTNNPELYKEALILLNNELALRAQKNA